MSDHEAAKGFGRRQMLGGVLIVLACVILASAEYYAFRMKSEAGLITIAGLTVVLTAVIHSDLESLRLRSPGVDLHAKKASPAKPGKKKPAKKKPSLVEGTKAA